MSNIRILVVGTYDTKADELIYLRERIESQGATAVTLDVSVLGDPPESTDYSKHDVAKLAGKSIDEIIALGDENEAMQCMAEGCSALVLQLYEQNKFDGLISLGGSMATDLALEVTQVLPIGVPKYIVSTVAFAAMIPPDRLAVDIQMILWAGGLYGLNSICKSTLSQAAGAVVGAANTVEKPQRDKPIIGITSLGKSCLKYMVTLKPELEKRGFEVAIFHATGMGGRAFESLASQGRFVAVMDFCTQELGNWLHGSIINAGKDRMLNAGKAGIPQLIAPGAIDMVDLPSWMPVPEKFSQSENHVHNRLINSVLLNKQERCEVATLMVQRIALSKAPVHVLLPQNGIQEWDRPNEPLHAPEHLKAFLSELKKGLDSKDIPYSIVDSHINDSEFCQQALGIFDQWLEEGLIKN